MLAEGNNKILANKKLVAFDVDGTLTISRSRIDPEMADLLKRLLAIKKVAIITGGAFANIKEQILDELNLPPKLNKNLILLPTNGGGLWIFTRRLMKWTRNWQEFSSHNFTIKEKEEIIQAIKEIDQTDPELCNNISFGREIQDRNSGITYAALGENAPTNIKKNWDPDFKKRLAIQKKLMEKLPNFEVKIGGTTSIDITPKGMDKAFGIKKIMEDFNMKKEDILFFGDAVYENGNDYPVSLMDVDTIRVTSPEETKERLIRLL